LHLDKKIRGSFACPELFHSNTCPHRSLKFFGQTVRDGGEMIQPEQSHIDKESRRKPELLQISSIEFYKKIIDLK
jgi:hypothetical protein